jgi:cytochrome c
MSSFLSRLLWAATAALACTAAAAQDGDALAKKYACSACHAMDRKLVGPSFKQVAEKYKGDAAASATLAQRIQKGSAGVWGAVPMPANPNIGDTDAAALAAWVMSR